MERLGELGATAAARQGRGATAASDSVEAGRARMRAAAARTHWVCPFLGPPFCVASMLGAKPASDRTGQGCQVPCVRVQIFIMLPATQCACVLSLFVCCAVQAMRH